MMAARYIGLRGQTIFRLNRKQFEDDPEGPTGKAVRYHARKNKPSVMMAAHGRPKTKCRPE
jgi:hypothetical protein